MDKTQEQIHILLVDDEKGYANVLANRLSRRSIETTKAHDGTQALQALRKKDFDVVVLDLKMEGMDGLQVLEIIRRMIPDLPVVLLSGHGSRDTAEEGLAMGAFDFLTKPCQLQELMDIIKKAAASRSFQTGNQEHREGKDQDDD